MVRAASRAGCSLRSDERDARFAEFFTSHPGAGSVLLLPVSVMNRCVAVLQACRAPEARSVSGSSTATIGQLFADKRRAGDRFARRRSSAPAVRSAAAGSVSPPEEARNASAAFRDVFLSAAASELKAPSPPSSRTRRSGPDEKALTPATRHEFSGGSAARPDRLVTLIDDVLDLVRLEMGRYLLDLRLGNVNQVTRAALESVREQVEARRIAVDLDLDASIPDQHLDPAKLRQALAHLLRNALRFSPERGRVRLVSYLTEQGVCLEVRDSGPPIPEEISAAVFDLESRETRHARGKGGQGFGLHLARRFVELHGGTAGARTSPDGRIDLLDPAPAR
jgi:signal transduction histidine kinase